MYEPSARVQTYVVCAVLIACFSILYPKIFHPLLLNFLGYSKSSRTIDDENDFLRHHTGHGPERPRPTMRSSEAQAQGKRGGLMAVVLPVYGVGILVYLIYTLSKVYKSKRQHGSTAQERKDEFLRHYYRDFHYDIDRGKFRMGHGSSTDEEGEEEAEGESNPKRKGFVTRGNGSSSRRGKSSYLTDNGSFDWAAAYGTQGQPNIYRSAKDLPRDLEALLMRLESEDISQDELSSLRTRLEKTECEMSKLLQAMDEAEQTISNMVNVDQRDNPACSDSESVPCEEDFSDPVDLGLD